MTLARALQVAAGNSQESADVAEAIDFDGTNDTLYRSSLTGAADGKTFTFSAWVWIDTTGSCQIVNIGNGSINIFVSENVLFMQVSSTSGGTRSITLDTFPTQVPLNTWANILYSADVTSTATRRLYINDVLVGTSYTDYNNINIDWTLGDVYVGGSTSKWDGRLSNVFLDYTYRDLSVEANRRLFVTADLKPAAGQAALNPILYLPMSHPTQPGKNMGTGGDFALTGTVARSGRGPNQYNAPYSDLDGSADFLSRTTAPTGIANGKQFTISYVAQPDTTGENFIFTIATSTSNRFYIGGNSGAIQIFGSNSSGTNILLAESASAQYVPNRNVVVTISIDLTDTSKRHFYVNGVAISAVWPVYTNADIQFNVTSTPNYRVGCSAGTTEFNGRLGALWFNTSYIDLSQPANLAKFVTGTGIDAKPVDLGANGELPTGTSPLIYLPMYGNNAGRNYGTGGNFTVNSGPYTGARGPNEFWGNKANFGNSTSNYLSRSSALVGNAGSVTTATFCCYFLINNTTGNKTLFGFGSAGSGTWQISDNKLFVWLGSGYVQFNQAVSSGVWNSLLFSRSGSTITAYLNGVALTIDGANSFNYGGAINFAATPVNIAIRNSGSSTSEPINGQLSELYLSSSYIDFSLESNRLKFRDAFGNPVNLTQQIEDAAIPNPAIYMRFPPTAFGTNSGTGGNFTVNGTITDGGQL